MGHMAFMTALQMLAHLNGLRGDKRRVACQQAGTYESTRDIVFRLSFQAKACSAGVAGISGSFICP